MSALAWQRWREYGGGTSCAARVTLGDRFADCDAECLGGEDGWRASVVVPRANGSTQPPSERHSAHRLPSREAAQGWCGRVAAMALEGLS